MANPCLSGVTIYPPLCGGGAPTDLSGIYGWIFGGGSDGVVDMDGTNTYTAFATTTGAAPNREYTLIRPVWATNFTLATSKILNAANYQVFATGTATINGTITAAGTNNTVNLGNGTVGTGAGINGPYVGGTQSGAAGNGVGAPAAGAASTTNGCISAGNAGGGGASSSAQAGAAGGAASSTAIDTVGGRGAFDHLLNLFHGYLKQGGTSNFGLFCGGPGGGGGGGVPATCTGGGGGSGAGIFGIFAKIIAGSGTLTAKGGDGNRGDWQAAGGGGGGGGAGGGIGVVTTTANWASLLTVDVSGGLGGATTGGGVAGSNGAAGRLVSIILAT